MHSRKARLGALLALSLFIVAGVTLPASGSDITGKAGVDTSIPSTDSAETVSGRGRFSDLKITVNQTKNLLNQAVSVTWKGGDPTREGAAPFHDRYLQVFQCWGDDDGTNPQNPGPPPEKCAFGARNGQHGGVRNLPFPTGAFVTDRIVSLKDWPNYESTPGVGTPQGAKWMPFKSVTGTEIGVHVDPTYNPSVATDAIFWQNPFFNIVTTNEIAGGRTLPNGTGSELFEVHTGIENAGLGCGQKVESVVGGATRIPKCWLVVVPRGDAEEENVGSSFEGPSSDQFGVVTSPLMPNAWKNRISIPLDFTPVDTPCDINADARRIGGTELIVPAVSSWQPELCSTPGTRPFAYGVLSDFGARQQLVSASPGAPGMVVVSRPVEAEGTSTDSPIVYAPLTLSGIVIGFNVERTPGLGVDEAARQLFGVRISELNLTPRLLAKLLTQSYKAQLQIYEDPDYAWFKKNPFHMGADEDFLQFNPEFKELSVPWSKNFASLLLPGATSDAAQLVWEYVLADPEAKRWLEGEPDKWGTVVNPVYALKAAANSTGNAFAETTPNNFPKSDPYCYQSPPVGNRNVVPPPLCGTDWVPYVQSFRDGARLTRAADDTARTNRNAEAPSPDRAWLRNPPQTSGRMMLSMTDSASARLFGIQSARLSRPGDNGENRRFIAPAEQNLTAAVDSMKTRSEPAVLEPDYKADVANAYPLTLLTYGAIKPLELSDEDRRGYATFIEYAAGAGQESGLELGKLPLGYAPMPAVLRTQSVNAAKKVVELKAPVEPASNGSDQGGSNTSSGDEGSSFSSPSFGGFSSSAADPATVVNQSSKNTTADNGTRQATKRFFTPAVAVPGTRFVLPMLVLLALGAALGALEVTKRPRRGDVS